MKQQRRSALKNFAIRTKKVAFDDGYNEGHKRGYLEGYEKAVKDIMEEMNERQWDKDIEKGIVNEELKQHMYNLWSLSGGRVGIRPPIWRDEK